jgi:hypothetical protein
MAAVARSNAHHRAAVCTATPTTRAPPPPHLSHPAGEQAAFFGLHAAALLAQRAWERAWPRAGGGAARAPPPRSLAARVAARALRHAAFLLPACLSAVLFFRPWFRASHHRELRVLAYGPAGWAVRVGLLGVPPSQARFLL